MGRSARKRRRLQDEGAGDADGDASPSLPNGQNHSSAAADEEPATSTDKQDDVFHEPLHNLPDDSATLASLLRETSSAVSGGPSRLKDPRRALLLLRHCAARLSSPELTDRLVPWCQFLTSALRSPRHQWCRDAACRALVRLVTEAARLEEAHRLLAGGPLVQLVTAIVDSAEKASAASLAALHAVLLHFGRGCGTLRNQLTDHLFELFDSARPSLSSAACRCVALLPHTGPSGSAGAAYVSAWGTQLRGLIACFHGHLDSLLDGIVEVQTFEVPEETLEREPPALEETEPIQLRYRLARRLTAIANCIQLMLSSKTQQPVPVPVSALLDLVIRCEAASSAAVPSAMEVRAARRCLDDVRAAAMEVLHSLVICCGPGLLMRGTVLNRLLISAVQPGGSKSTASSPAADTAHCQALRTFTAWLRVTGGGSGLQVKAEELVKTLTEDVRPPEPAKLTLQPKSSANGVSAGGGAGGKRKRKSAADWLEPAAVGGASGSRHDPGRSRRCRAALEVLTQLVTSLGPLLKVSTHESLQRLCIGLLSELHRSPSPPPPYSVAACRLGLYRLLVALVSDPHPSWPAPLQFAGPILARGRADADMAISTLCQSGLAIVTRCLQPTHPSLFFPVDLSEYSKPPPVAESATDDVSPDDASPPAAASDATADPAVEESDGDESVTLEVRDMSPVSSASSATDANNPTPRPTSTAPSTSSSNVTPESPAKAESAPPEKSTVALSFGTRVTTGPSSQASDATRGHSSDLSVTPGTSKWGEWPPVNLENQPAGPSSGQNRAPVTTVDIADSDTASSEDEVKAQPDEVDLAEDEQGSVEMLDQTGFNVDEKPSVKSSPGDDDDDDDDDDDVKILETNEGDGARDSGDEMAPDVAEMLKDFVPEDPEVE